jgi:hypothetical protein
MEEVSARLCDTSSAARTTEPQESSESSVLKCVGPSKLYSHHGTHRHRPDVPSQPLIVSLFVFAARINPQIAQNWTTGESPVMRQRSLAR